MVEKCYRLKANNLNLDLSDTLVIIPTYNESGNVERMIHSLFSLYPPLSILIIDDGSPDKTGDIVRNLQSTYKGLHLIERRGKLGLGTAYLNGFQWALERSFKYIAQMDCDFSHDPSDLLKLRMAAEESDLAIGSRYLDGGSTKEWPWYRLIISRLGFLAMSLVTGLKIADPTSGFKCFKRSALESINLKQVISVGYVFQCEINFRMNRLNKKISEVPILFSQRTHGESKMNFSIILEALIVVVKLRFLSDQ